MEYKRCDVSVMYPVWKRNVVLERYVNGLRVKDKRIIFQYLRDSTTHENSYFPLYGFTAGEFAVWHIIADSGKRTERCTDKKKSKSTTFSRANLM